jgi:phosphatidylserine/phosphatidylglycerophosphate/cardiolipin synthase-like enzyme
LFAIPNNFKRFVFQLFMCPGKREAPGPHLDRLQDPTESFAKIFRQTLRSPIYVHSKMMIVDDVYAIVGSANINQVIYSNNDNDTNSLPFEAKLEVM